MFTQIAAAFARRVYINILNFIGSAVLSEKI